MGTHGTSSFRRHRDGGQETLSRQLTKNIRSGMNFVYPPACPWCGAGLPDSQRFACEDCRSLLASLAGLQAETEGARIVAGRRPLLVPIPQHWTQRATRSHNPAETIAWRLARELRLEFDANILAKARRTGLVKQLAATERRSKAARCFFC